MRTAVLVIVCTACAVSNTQDGADDESTLGSEGSGDDTPQGSDSADDTPPGDGDDTGSATGNVDATDDAGSTDDGPPHMVGDCDEVGAPGTWENITPPGTTFGASLMLHPSTSGTLFVGTEATGIHRSDDCGSTWTKINTGRGGDVIDTGTNWSMAIDHSDPDILYTTVFQGANLHLQKSTNGGVDWAEAWGEGSEIAQNVEYGGYVQEVYVDPTLANHLSVSFHANCVGDYAPQCMAESFDRGETWTMFKGPGGGWEENARLIALGESSLLYATFFGGVHHSDDHGATWVDGGSFGGGHQVYRAQDGNYYLGSLQGMNRSVDGRVWTHVDESPITDGLTGDGVLMYAGCVDNCGDTFYWTSPETDGNTWTPLPAAGIEVGARYLAYDADHHVLYSANAQGGAWRMVTR